MNCQEMISDSLLLSGSSDGYLRSWDVEQGVCVEKIKIGYNIFGMKLISSKLLALATFSNKNNLEIYDLQSNSFVSTFRGHSHYVLGFGLCKEKNLLFSFSNDHTIRDWIV